MTLVPGIVDDSLVFTQKLASHAATHKAFRLEEDATRLTVDIIGKVTLDLHLDTQRGENEMITAFREQVTLLPNEGFMDPLKMVWPSGIYKRWRNSRVMERYLGKVLEKRLAKEGMNGRVEGKKERKRVIVDLALQEYQKMQSEEGGEVMANGGIDEKFKKAAITQIRTFIFAGAFVDPVSNAGTQTDKTSSQATTPHRRRFATPRTCSRSTQPLWRGSGRSTMTSWDRLRARQTR